ncbi:MAG: hypothetical protein C0626_03470 [Arcobacter sp.]|uniref:hypothetical protein n=1 Tax=uncultured Arcobacter sp. TaxID=165434 RepID=UPI000CC317F9|nr:hypothetical protein [uncultured Arcobacter sp.]PLY10708.1 MAG: hypothetical protein C0626_03470 [Arcobacter sp.]
MIRLKIFALLCSLFWAFTLYASEDVSQNNHNHIYKSLDYLNLSAAQYEDIKEVLIKYRKKYSKYYHKKEKEEKKLQQLFQKEYFDKDEYEEIVEEIHEETIELEAKKFKKIHEILNAKQRKQFSYYLQEWRVE